ncbi:hypothetical protein Bca101_047930 [Brassica carinata]
MVYTRYATKCSVCLFLSVPMLFFSLFLAQSFFGSCLSTDSLEEENYKTYLTGAVNQLQEHFPDASSLVFNFRDVVDTRSVMADVLSEHGLTVMDYPRHYQGCSLLPVKVMKKFLCYCNSWLSLGPSKLILLHCERGAWPVLAFMLAALLIYRKQYSDEYKTLDMICKKAPVELMHLFSPLNPIPSQLRYLQYVSRRTMVSEWPPMERALTVDCVMLRCLPDVSGQGSFLRPVFRVYGQDPLFVDDDKKKPELLYSSAKKGKHLKIYKQLFSNKVELVKIDDINCHVQGDIVIELMPQSNILTLNRDEVDTLWDIKEQFPKGFGVEILFSDMDDDSSVDLTEKVGLPVEAFSNVHEFFNPTDWDDATRNTRQHLAIANGVQEIPDGKSSPVLQGLSPPIGAPNDVASLLGQPVKSPPPVSKSDKTTALPRPPPPPPPPPPPVQHSDQKTATRVFIPIPPPSPATAASPPPPPPPPPAPQTTPRIPTSSSPPTSIPHPTLAISASPPPPPPPPPPPLPTPPRLYTSSTT